MVPCLCTRVAGDADEVSDEDSAPSTVPFVVDLEGVRTPSEDSDDVVCLDDELEEEGDQPGPPLELEVREEVPIAGLLFGLSGPEEPRFCEVWDGDDGFLLNVSTIRLHRLSVPASVQLDRNAAEDRLTVCRLFRRGGDPRVYHAADRRPRWFSICKVCEREGGFPSRRRSVSPPRDRTSPVRVAGA
jgi:hypothetical protein